MSNKGVISKIFKEISKLHNKKASNPIKNEQILRIFFTKKDIQVENKQWISLALSLTSKLKP